MFSRSLVGRFRGIRHRAMLLSTLLLLPALAAAHPHGPGNGGSAPPLEREDKLDPDLFLQVTLARTGDGDTEREKYVLDLLELALESADVAHELSTAGHANGGDALVHVLTEGHHHANIAVGPPGEALTRELRPVYFPVHRGLPGYRLPVIARGEQPRFSDAAGMDDLRSMKAAVRAGSGDRELLAHNRLPATGMATSELADAVAEGRVDYAALPPEQALELARNDRRVVLEETLALTWRGDEIFYVAPDAGKLVAALDEGLMAAHHDGSLAEFQRTHPYLAGIVERTGLDGRRTLVVDHPDARRALQRAPADLWLQP